MKQRLILFLFLLWTNIGFAQLQGRVQGEVLVRLNENVSALGFVDTVLEFSGKSSEFQIKSQISEQANIYLFSFDNQSTNGFSLLQYLKGSSLVSAAQFNHYVQTRTAPNDLLYSSQWHLNNPDYGVPGVDVDAELAWDISTGGTTAQGDTIVLAIIDDGIDITHNDLKQNLWKNYAEIPFNDIDDDNNGYVDDYHGWNVFSQTDYQGIGSHGTRVAGVMGAAGNNGIGITGVNWNVKILSVMAMGGTEADVIAAYNYVLTQRQIYQETNGAQGAFVVATNTSFGIDGGNPADAPLWCDFFDLLGENGIINVASTTNNDVNVDEYGDLPTACTSPYLISVTASNHFDERIQAGYGVNSIDLAAPGFEIKTTNQGNSTGHVTGTSFSAPIVTGLVGLLYALPCEYFGAIAQGAPQTAATLIRDFIFAGVEQVPDFESTTLTGGRVNLYNSLLAAQNLCTDCAPSILSSAVPVSLSAIEISFIDFDSDNTDLWWRPVGSTDWTIETDVSSPFTLTNLSSCTAYEFYFHGHCNSMNTSSPIYTTQTTGCCLPPLPTDISWELTDTADVLINWPVVPEAAGYVYQISYDSIYWTEPSGTILPPYSLTDLSQCAYIFVRVAAICNDTIGAWSIPITIETDGCGTCTDYSYCSSEGTFSGAEYIESIVINDQLFTSGNDGGYGNHTGESILLSTDYPIEFTLTPGFPVITYLENWRIWIDLNQDGEFSEDELVFETTAPQVEPVIGSFDVPEELPQGLTRMRISMKYLNTEPPQSPCETFTYGEVEDYCVTFFNGGSTGDLNCLAPQEFTVEETLANSAHISWETIENAENYEVSYYNYNQQFIQEIYTSVPEIFLNNLIICDTFNLTVKSQCPLNESAASADFIFSTDCTNSVSETSVDSKPQISISPNPFYEELTIFSKNLEISNTQTSVYSIDGKLLYHNTHTIQNDNTLVIKNLEELPSGVYFIKVQSEDFSGVTKAIKE